jgi:autoinducer 2-degrading protein
MFTVVVEFHIYPAHVQDFKEAIVQNARQSVDSEDGCHQFDVCCNPTDSSQFFLYELYDDEAAFKIHLQSAHFRAMNATTAPWVLKKFVKTFVRVQPLRT